MHPDKENGFEGRWYQHPQMRNALVSGLITGIAFTLAHTGVISSSLEISLFILAIIIGGYHWTKEGIEEFSEEREIGIEALMFFATVGSAVLGMWDEAATLVFLYGAAEGLEEYTYARTRSSIRKLLDLAPKTARIIKDGEEITIPAEELKVGDIFIVRPGESIPTDGIILKGKSSVNEAAVTGESIPVVKKEGMTVFAATLNHDGALQVKTTATFQDNTLSKMIHLVEEAQEQKSKAQTFIERFGRRYSPIVLLSAICLIVVPFLLGLPISSWAKKAVVLLVAAAPCALIMSTPVAVAAAIGKAGRSGVLIKGGVALENLGKIKAVAFDKTGTLTKSHPIVTDIIAFHSDEKEILQLSASVENMSEHPLARAIVARAKQENIEFLTTTGFKSIAGYGAQAKIDGEVIIVGKQKLFAQTEQPEEILKTIERFRADGKTVIMVGTREQIKGIIAIRDEIRASAKEMVENLHKSGIKVVMLTGDNEATAKAFAEILGIDDVRADLKPEEKITVIKELQEEFGHVAMVGDGINDAPALAQASVGIAMGTAGTDAAIEAADIALMADDLEKVTYALNLGKRTRKVSLQNIIFSTLLLVIMIPLALTGLLGVAAAVLFHEASELLAVANGLRLAK